MPLTTQKNTDRNKEVIGMEKLNLIRRAYISSAYSSRKKRFCADSVPNNAEKFSESAIVKAEGWYSRKKDPVPLLMDSAKLLVDKKSNAEACTLLEKALSAIESNPAAKENLHLELENLVSLVNISEPPKAPEILARAIGIAAENGDRAAIALELSVKYSEILLSGSENEKKQHVDSLVGDIISYRMDLHIANGALLDLVKILVKNDFGKEAVTLIRHAIACAYSTRLGNPNWGNYISFIASEGTKIAGDCMDKDDWKSIGMSVAMLARNRFMWDVNWGPIFTFLSLSKNQGPADIASLIVEETMRFMPKSEHDEFRQVYAKLKYGER